MHSHNMQSSVKISILHQVKHYIALYYACIFDSGVRQHPYSDLCGTRLTHNILLYCEGVTGSRSDSQYTVLEWHCVNLYSTLCGSQNVATLSL